MAKRSTKKRPAASANPRKPGQKNNRKNTQKSLSKSAGKSKGKSANTSTGKMIYYFGKTRTDGKGSQKHC